MALFLSSYGEDVIGGVHMVDTTGLVEACVSIRPGVEIFQIFWLHVGHTEVLIGVIALGMNNEYSPGPYYIGLPI